MSLFRKERVMKREHKKSIVTLVGTLLLIAVTSLSVAESNRVSKKTREEAVAIVNGEAIFRVDFEREVNSTQKQLLTQGQVPDVEKMREVILENLIDGELLYQESQKKGFKVDEEKINEQFESIKGQFTSEEEFKNAMNEMNYTESSLKNEINRGIAIQDLIDGEIAQNITVSEEESLEYYESNLELFKQPEQVRASHILITVDEQADVTQKDKALQKIKEIQQKLKAGENFASLAREYSQGPSSAQGGDLGYFQRGQMLKPFEDAAFTLQPGETSTIVKTRFGYHLIKVIDRKPEGTIPYNYVQKKIDQYLKQNKVYREVKLLLEKLRAKATIERLVTEEQKSEN